MDSPGANRTFPTAIYLPSRSFNNIEQHLRLYINEKGAIVIEGQDLGTGVGQLLPTSNGECEYWLTLPPECKDWVLLNLIRDHFTVEEGKSLDTLFREWLEARNIPHEFSTYY